MTTTIDLDKGAYTTTFTSFSTFALAQKPASGGGAHGGRCFAGASGAAGWLSAAGVALAALAAAGAVARRRRNKNG